MILTSENTLSLGVKPLIGLFCFKFESVIEIKAGKFSLGYHDIVQMFL